MVQINQKLVGAASALLLLIIVSTLTISFPDIITPTGIDVSGRITITELESMLTELGVYFSNGKLVATDANIDVAKIDLLFTGRTITELDLNVIRDTNMLGSLQVSGDSNFILLSVRKIFGDGSGLTGVTATTNWVDLNAHLVPYIDAIKDMNLGVHKIKAYGDSNFGVIQVLKIFGDGSGLTGVTGTTNWSDINAHLVPYIGATKDVNLGAFGLRVFGDVNFGSADVLENLFVGDNVYAVNEIWGSYLASRFGGSIDMRADPWELVTVGLGVAGGLRVDGDTNLSNAQADYFHRLNALGDSNVVNLGVSGRLFGDGSGLTGIAGGTYLPDTTLDNNVLAQQWFWNRIADLAPWEDANILTYIPREIDIDQNAMLLDKNWSNTWGLFDANMLATPRNYSADMNFTNIQADTFYGLNAIWDSNFNAIGAGNIFIDSFTSFGNSTLLGYLYGASDASYNPFSLDFTSTAEVNIVGAGAKAGSGVDGGNIFIQGGAGDTGVFGNVGIKSQGTYNALFNTGLLTSSDKTYYFPDDNGIFAISESLTKDTTCDNNATCTTWADARYPQQSTLTKDTTCDKNVACRTDLNNMYVPYIDTAKDVNFGVHTIKAYGDSNFGITSIETVYVGPFKIDWNSTALVIGG